MSGEQLSDDQRLAAFAGAAASVDAMPFDWGPLARKLRDSLDEVGLPCTIPTLHAIIVGSKLGTELSHTIVEWSVAALARDVLQGDVS